MEMLTGRAEVIGHGVRPDFGIESLDCCRHFEIRELQRKKGGRQIGCEVRRVDSLLRC